MTSGVAYLFHISSSASTWHGHRVVATMSRRRAAKPGLRRKSARKKTALLISKFEFIRRPVTLALTLGLAAAVVGYVMLRRLDGDSLKSNALHTSESKMEVSTRFPKAPVFEVNVSDEFDHDPAAFTQGLVFHGGFFYESTGLLGQSSLRRVDVPTGRVVDSLPLPELDFGEGLALTGKNLSKVVQVIWKVGKGYVYDRKSLQKISSFSFDGDAWGLASLPTDRSKMFLSDGTSTLKLMQLKENEFRLLRKITVKDGQRELGLLNELEIVGNELWANVWMSDFVARIDIDTGTVNSWIDLRGLLRQSDIPEGHTPDVLNGIAYDPASGDIYVTGKQWPKLYRISVSQRKIAEEISELTNPFFLDPEQVAYVHRHVIG